MGFLDAISWIGGLFVGLMLLLIIVMAIIMGVQVMLGNKVGKYRTLDELEARDSGIYDNGRF